MNTTQEFPTFLLSLPHLCKPERPTEKTTARQKTNKELLKHYGGGGGRKVWGYLSLNTSPAELPSHRQFQRDGLQVEKSPDTCKDDGGGTDGMRESEEDTVPPLPGPARGGKTDASHLREIIDMRTHITAEAARTIKRTMLVVLATVTDIGVGGAGYGQHGGAGCGQCAAPQCFTR
ncbi:41_t:CDS:2 [Paraglomus occultum]|uniref:41_t:CDS:1 n=1 Tax=Paraglomus occultum TaxID=144539 RepID=A0A9N8WP86_9GLOM|nr:41_t:CDS:2 [Paraglomus occultum]